MLHDYLAGLAAAAGAVTVITVIGLGRWWVRVILEDGIEWIADRWAIGNRRRG